MLRGSRFKKHIIFAHTVHYCYSSMLHLSETRWFLQSSSFWEARRALIGQLSSVLWLAVPQAWDGNVIIPLTYCDACPGKTRPITNETFVASTGDIITDYNDLGYVHTWRLFWQEKVDERFFNEKQSWQRLLQIAAESVFCCHSNSCNSSIALCAAEMSRKSTKLALALAFEVNGK